MVTELGMRHCDNVLGEDLFDFKVNAKFVFKGLVFPDSTTSGEKGADLEQAFQSHAWIIAQLLRDMLGQMLDEMGGQREVSFIDTNELVEDMKRTADEMNAFADTGLLPPDENGVAWVAPTGHLEDLFDESSEESLDEDDDDSL
jgi:hypothetical protein